MTDSMSRYGQAAGMVGPDAMCRPPGAGPPPSSALWQGVGYVYSSMDPGIRNSFVGQPYRAPYPPYAGTQYVEPYDQYISGPIPPEYPPPLNVRYATPDKPLLGGGGGVGGNGATATGGGGAGGAPAENNGMGGYPAAAVLPPFSTIAGHPAVGPGGRGPPTPGLKDEMGEFGEGLGARLNRSGGGGGNGNSGGPPTPGGGTEFGEGRLGRGGEENPNASPSLVQYRPWEAGSAPRGEHSGGPSAHASPTSPTSSYSFAEGFLKFQPGTPSSEKSANPGGVGGNSNNNNNNNHHHQGSGGGNPRNDGAGGNLSPGTGGHHDDKWFHGKGGGGGRGEAAPSPAEKHGKDGGSAGGPTSLSGKNGNEVSSGSGPSQQGFGGDGSSGAEDSKHGHYPNNYDNRDMLLSFGSPHPSNPYDYYPAAPAPSGAAPWSYPAEVQGKAPANYQSSQRAYNQNGRDGGVYGNGSGPERSYQLSPHDKLTPTPPPTAGGAYHSNTHGVAPPPAKGGKRGRGSRGGGSNHHHHHHRDMDKMGGLGDDPYGGPPSKQQALSSGDDPSAPGSDKPKKKKRKRCGECYGCQRKDNCGECAPCRNEKSHQICKMRRCEKLIERKPGGHSSASASSPAPPPPPPSTGPPNVPNPTHLPPLPPSLPPPHAHSPASDKLQYLGAPSGGGGGGPAAWW